MIDYYRLIEQAVVRGYVRILESRRRSEVMIEYCRAGRGQRLW